MTARTKPEPCALVAHKLACYDMLVDALRELLSFMGEPTSNAGETEIRMAQAALARADAGPTPNTKGE